MMRAIKMSLVVIMSDFWEIPKDRGWLPGDPTM